MSVPILDVVSETVTVKVRDWDGVRIERDRYALRYHALVRQVEAMLSVLDSIGRCTPKQHRQWEKELESNRWEPSGREGAPKPPAPPAS